MGHDIIIISERSEINASRLLLMYSRGFVALFGMISNLALSRIFSAHADGLGRAECCEAVHEGYADLDLCILPVEVSGGDALSEELDTSHLGFHTTSSVISGLFLPVGPPEPLAGT